MSEGITINDIIELEAYAQSLLDKARKMRMKLQTQDERKRKSNIYNPQDMARVKVQWEKNRLRAQARLANKKAGS